MKAETAIIKTLSYFDVFNFPLTKEELLNYLWQGHEQNEVEVNTALQALVSAGKVGGVGSYYFLPGREDIIVKRNLAVAHTEKKLRRAQFAIKLISGIPFLKAVFVCNSVAAETASAESDIDFFIVSAEGRLWLVRFFSNLILRVLGLRTGKLHSANRVCLSFFVGEKHLDLTGLRICEEDIYLVYWLRQLYPLYDPKNFLIKIWRANGWAKDYLKLPSASAVKNEKPDQFKIIIERALQGKTGDGYEKILKKIQWSKLRPELKKLAEENGKEVVINEGVLKFHETDARMRIRETWLKNIQKYVS
ncbi:MAG: hypothetical protein WC725_04245 [Patescibacteria group bacterium]|jgi:hypothetical protein